MSDGHRRERPATELGWLWPAVAYLGCGIALAPLVAALVALIWAGLR